VADFCTAVLDLQTGIDRNRSSIKFKHQNISAVPKRLGADRIPCCKPAFDFQMTLVDAVARCRSRPVGPDPRRGHVTSMQGSSFVDVTIAGKRLRRGAALERGRLDFKPASVA